MPLPRLDRWSRLRTVGAMATATATVALLPAAAAAEPRDTHRIERGETLSEIAARYGVSSDELARANNLSDPDLIAFGRMLRLPTSSSPGGAGTSGTHTVAPGETLSGIAARYGLTTQELVAVNALEDPHQIRAGGQLRLSATTGAPASDAPEETVLHTVAPGETLSGIAANYRVPAAAIVTVNGIVDSDRIVAGSRLQVPVTGRPAAGVASRDAVESIIEQKARQHGWDPNLIKALAWQESGWNNDAVSSVGAVGIMQVLPSTNREVSQRRAGRSLDLSSPADNVEAGIHFLDLLYDLTDGDTERMLAGYYQGLASVRENGVYPSTERYIANVLALWDRFEATG